MRSKAAHSKKGWKYVQSKRQTTKRTKLALIVLATIFLLLLLSQAVKFTQMLFSPWNKALSVKRTMRWNGDFNINVLLKAKGVSLMTFSPQNQKITIINIPEQTYVEVPHGFGKWQMSSIYGLGGDQLLKDTMVNFFGLPINGFLDFSGKYSQKEIDVIVSEIRENPFSIINILPYLKTDLTPFELMRLKLGLSGVRFDKIKEVNLLDSLQKEKLPDGTEVLSPDTIKQDSILSDMKDFNLQSEHKTIAIFNSTNYPGLAQKAARLVTNIGGNVIITSNGQKKLKTTVVVGEKSKTLERLRQIFNSGGIIDPKDEDLASSRAQINLFLGEDYSH